MHEKKGRGLEVCELLLSGGILHRLLIRLGKEQVVSGIQSYLDKFGWMVLSLS